MLDGGPALAATLPAGEGEPAWAILSCLRHPSRASLDDVGVPGCLEGERSLVRF